MSDQLRALGQVVTWTAFALIVVYAGVTLAGLLSLPAPDQPIADPYFTSMEVLILILAPVLVAVMAVIRAWAVPERKIFARAALVFMSITGAITSMVHLAVLTLSRAPAMAAQRALFEFRWPSPVYVLDILAWDVFFALGAVCAALAFARGGLGGWVRRLFMASAIVSAMGLVGVALSDMTIRSVGVAGYALIFPAGIACFAVLLRQRGLMHRN